jgi:outer membrane immunogenic protein
MRKIAISLLATTALMAVAGFAQAADIARPIAAPRIVAPALSTWTGVYFGVNLGWANTFGQINDVAGTFEPAGFTNVKSANGFLLGGQIGYDWQIGNAFVVGAVADVSGVFGEDAVCGGAGCVNGTTGGTAALSYNVKGLGSIAGRAGFLLGQQTLLYGLLGWAEGAVTTNDYSGVNSAQADGSSRLFSGWVAGVGAEMKVTDHASISLEGRYYDLGSKTFVDAAATTVGAHPKVWTVELGAKYRF